jgi:antitoxin (DNA-binding transcriptional repressor) of toxin-antitoxin stability system
MDEIAVSKFKATCLAALDRVRRTGRPLRVTRFGKPLADVVPAQPAPTEAGWLGAMRGRGRVAGELVAPVSGGDEWDALRSGCSSIRTSGCGA